MSGQPVRGGWKRKPTRLFAGPCPVAGGRQTTMLRRTFVKMCIRQQLDFDSSCRNICKGRWPQTGLTLIEDCEIEEKFTHIAKETIMPKKEGICPLCKKEKNLNTTYELQTCSTCGFVVRAVKLTPQLVIDEMQRQWGEKYFGGGTCQADYDQARRQLHAMETLINDVRGIICRDTGEETIIEAVLRLVKERDYLYEQSRDNIAAAQDLYNKIADLLGVEPADDLLAVIKNRMQELHSLQTLINDYRNLLGIGPNGSIIEAVQQLQDEVQKEIDVWFKTGIALGVDTPVAEQLPIRARELMQELQDLKDGAWVYLDENEDTTESRDPGSGEYQSLRRVLDLALDQAANGKGKERHANEGEPFEKQKICEIARRVGLAFPIGQAIKKAEESVRLGLDAGIRENLGAIKYLAAAVIVMEETAARSSLYIPV